MPAAPPAKGGMSGMTKFVLGCGCLLVFLCVCACAGLFIGMPMLISSSFGADPVKAKQVGAQIADYKLPAGYGEQMSMDLFVAKMVLISRGADGALPVWLMMQAQGLNRAQIEEQMRQAIQGQLDQNGADVEFARVGEESVTIKGKPAVMTIYEGRSKSGGPGLIRQGVVSFEGKGGTVVLMILSDVAEWNTAEITAFLGSIR